MAFVRQIAQRVTVLHFGQVFDEGSLERIISNEDVVRIYLGKV
jgi:branched-chain amino acid transport system ATP-binding protein